MKDGKNGTDRGDARNLGLMRANARGYMLSPLRGWLHAVQYHFLNCQSFVTQLQNSRVGLPKRLAAWRCVLVNSLASNNGMAVLDRVR